MKNQHNISLFLICIISCDVPTERIINIDAPKFIQKSMPDSKVELGIDSEFRLKHGIQLMWYSNSKGEVDYYSIFRGNTSIDSTIEFKRIGDVAVNDPLKSDTLFHDTTALTHVDYYYFIEGVGHKGVEGKHSDTISYTMHDKPDAIAPANTIQDSLPVFSWINNVTNFQYTSEFVLRVERIVTDSTDPVWTVHFYNEWFGFENYTPIYFQFFPATSTWEEGNDTFHPNAPSNTISCFGLDTGLSPGSYRWKIKSISQMDNESGIDLASGESPWKYFSIQY